MWPLWTWSTRHQTRRRSAQHRTRRFAAGVEALEVRTLLTSALYVDANNTSGTVDGTATHPYPTIQAAIDVATDDTAIYVAQGTYHENLVVGDLSLQLRGGYLGGTTNAYAMNQAGDFSAASPDLYVTQVAGAADKPVIYFPYLDVKTVVIDGFDISGGLHGIFILGDYLQYPNVTINNNIIENNGPAELQAGGGEYAYVGGGVYSSNVTLTLTNNLIRNNNSNRGGGLYAASKTEFTITDNVIENNSGYDDHAGGIYLVPLPAEASGEAVFSHNIIRGNTASKAFTYGWAGGILISGSTNPDDFKPLTLSHNIYTENSSPSQGGAIFVDNGAKVILDHELIYNNHTTTVGGAAVFVDGDGGGTGSFLTMRNCTVANNSADNNIGNGIYVMEYSDVSVVNSIFWGNADDFYVDETSSLSVTYTDSQESISGTGNISLDPLFADPASGDFHLLSTGGRYDPTAQGGAGGFVLDDQDSPAIDAGDPDSVFLSETSPNGGRINLGYDGNTAFASRSPFEGIATSVELTCNPNPSFLGGSVTLTAVIHLAQNGSSAPTGKVHFFDGATELQAVSLQVTRKGIMAVLTMTSLGAGIHDITAVYAGDPHYATSTSAVVHQVVNLIPTSLTLKVAPRAGSTEQTFTLTATLSSRSKALPLAGTVTFKDGDNVLQTITLTPHAKKIRVTFHTDPFSQGTHQISAVYSGNAQFQTSQSAVIPLSITPAKSHAKNSSR